MKYFRAKICVCNRLSTSYITYYLCLSFKNMGKTRYTAIYTLLFYFARKVKSNRRGIETNKNCAYPFDSKNHY